MLGYKIIVSIFCLRGCAGFNPGIQLAVLEDAGVAICDRCGTKINSTIELIRIFNLENSFTLLNEGLERTASTDACQETPASSSTLQALGPTSTVLIDVTSRRASLLRYEKSVTRLPN